MARKIIVHVAMTLDGFIEGPNGELDWLVRDETIDFGDILAEILADKDAILYGRVSYDRWGDYSPDSGDEKLRSAYQRLHSMQKYVLSRKITGETTDARFISLNTKAMVDDLKSRPGKNIWLYGGQQAIGEMINLGVVDEFKLAVHPVIIGRGLRLFEDIETRHQLELIEVTGHPSGVTHLHYSQKLAKR